MSDGMNKVILLGNLGATPELRYTPAGVAVLSMRIATNESWRDKNKEVQERTEWHNVVVFGNRAEGLGRILAKGTILLVEGGLRTTSYEKDGQTRYRTEVHAREVLFAGRKPLPGDRAVFDDGGPVAKPPPLPGSLAGEDEAPGLAKARSGGFGAVKKAAVAIDELPY